MFCLAYFLLPKVPKKLPIKIYHPSYVQAGLHKLLATVNDESLSARCLYSLQEPIEEAWVRELSKTTESRETFILESINIRDVSLFKDRNVDKSEDGAYGRYALFLLQPKYSHSFA
ncbi:TPA: hypothetical protein DEW49_06280 [bacterium]|nr:hypothetical protein [bacterium]